ncbi:MAG: hypothetical protein IIZ92_29710, partial [Aquincola sp.]|nr:hypothetical protein [Aquincola sp.]
MTVLVLRAAVGLIRLAGQDLAVRRVDLVVADLAVGRDDFDIEHDRTPLAIAFGLGGSPIVRANAYCHRAIVNPQVPG